MQLTLCSRETFYVWKPILKIDWLHEHNDDARASHFFVHFFDVHYTTTTCYFLSDI